MKTLFGGSSQKAMIQEALSKGAVIVDVRSPQEFAGGHIAGAKNIPLGSIEGKVEQIRQWKKPVVLCCASGMRSSSATTILKKHGIEAYNAGSWHELK
ncbi:MAG: rhodanese-like domain-containing protein [Thermoflexibacteraceae bacterium]